MSIVVPVMPDALQVIRYFLCAKGLVRVSTIDPTADTATPWLRLSSAGGQTADPRTALWSPRVDLSAFAPAPEQASTLARQAHAALMGVLNCWTPYGHLASCSESVGMQDLTDPTRTPPLYRQVFSVVTFLRP